MLRNHWRTVSFFFLIALFLTSVSSSHAQVTTVTDFKSVVRAGNNATYLDLLHRVFPDVELSSAAGEATAHKTIPLNHLFGDYTGTVYQEEMKIGSIETPGEQTSNGGRLLLLFHVTSDNGGLSAWNELSVLALFELKPSLRLLDAVDVQADKFSEFWEGQPIIQVDAKTEALIISNSHHNSSQGYQSLTIVAPVNDRIRNLFELPVLLNSNDCGNKVTQTASISTVKGPTRGFFSINVQVKSVKNPDDESCEKRTKGYTRNYKATLVWNGSKRKYQSRGVGLDQLARFNKARF